MLKPRPNYCSQKSIQLHRLIQSNNLNIEHHVQRLSDVLLLGDEHKSRQVILDLYFSKNALSKICDLVISPTLKKIDIQCNQGEVEIYQVRLACVIMRRILSELRNHVSLQQGVNPLAIGCTTSNDYDELGTTMVELVLRGNQWNAMSLGCNLPFSTLAKAIKVERPRLFWFFCSHIMNHSKFLKEYSILYKEFGFDVAFVVGGSALTPSIRRKMKYTCYCDNLRQFEAFANFVHRLIF